MLNMITKIYVCMSKCDIPVLYPSGCNKCLCKYYAEINCDEQPVCKLRIYSNFN